MDAPFSMPLGGISVPLSQSTCDVIAATLAYHEHDMDALAKIIIDSGDVHKFLFAAVSLIDAAGIAMAGDADRWVEGARGILALANLLNESE